MENNMNWRNTPDRYGTLSMALHWLMLLLLVAVYACIELRELYPKGSDPREALKAWHFMLGLSVLLLVPLRLIARMIGPMPRIEPEPGQLQRLSAGLLHLALYVLMIGLPLCGWLLLSAAGKPIPFFGLQLPALIEENKELAKQIKEVHEAAATVGYILAGLHAAAALTHHYLIKDNTLQRMLPPTRRETPACAFP
jgi:superoxide oxidase